MPIYADYMSLPAFARRCCSNQSISPALPIGPTAANLQQRVCCCGRTLEQTDGQTDGQTPYRLILYGHAVSTLMLEPGGRGDGPTNLAAPKLWLGLSNLAVLLTHCGQLILKKLENLMPPDVRF